MREFFTSLLDFLGLLLIAAGVAYLVGHVGAGLLIAGVILLAGSALASRFARTPRSDE